METWPSINRTAVVLFARQPFLDWLNETTSDDSFKWSIGMINDEPPCYLIREHDSPEELERYLDQIKEPLFEEVLRSWVTDESTWPDERGPEVFDEWFDLHYTTVVQDVDANVTALEHDDFPDS